MKTIDISVVIPYFNSHSTVAASIKSVLSSTFPIQEVVVVDDGSSPTSNHSLRDIIDETNDSRVRLIEHKYNLGGGSARNTGVTNSSNEWIFCLDADNIIPSNLLGNLASLVMNSKNDVHVAVPETVAFFEDGSFTISHAWRMDVDKLTINDYLRFAIVPGASGNYLFTRESWEKSGAYPTRSGALDAWGFGFRQFTSGFPPAVSPGTFYFHRLKGDSYYVRDSLNSVAMSTRATALVLEAVGLLGERQLRRILSPRRAGRWFGALKVSKPSRNLFSKSRGECLYRSKTNSKIFSELDSALMASSAGHGSSRHI